MTQAPPSVDAATPASKNESGPATLVASLGDSGAAQIAEAGPAPTREQDFPDPSDTVLVDQAGRPLGPRALQTRRKILDAAVTLLSEKPLRDMRVIDIARRIGSSPATFYQYFKDVEDVVLQLASQMKEATPQIVELIGGDWEGREGHERGCRIATMVIDHWEKYAPVLRARNNASDEGNLALRQERMAAMLPLVEAFKLAIERAHARAAAESGSAGGSDSADDSAGQGAWEGGQVNPLVGATAISSCLERLSMYHAWIAELGGTREELVETTATLMQSLLTTRR